MEKLPISRKYAQDDKFLNALAEAYRLQEAIIGATELAVISTNPEGTITSFNKAAENLLGYTADEVVGRETPVLFHDQGEILSRAAEIERELHQQIKGMFEVFTYTALHSRQPDRREWTYIRKNGVRFPVLLSISPLRDENDKIFGYAGIATDISEQKDAERAVKESEEKFRLLAENVPGAIYLANNDEKRSAVYLNHKIKAITGYSPDDFLTGEVNLRELYHPEDAERISLEINNALNERRSFTLEYRIRHRAAEWRWIKEFGIGLYEGDRLRMIEGVITDITSQRLAEETIQKIADENYSIFNNAVNLNAIAGFDGYFKRLNPMWQEVFGWTIEELTSVPFVEFVHPDDREPSRQATAYISSGNNLQSFENRYRCKDGTYRWLIWSSVSDAKNGLIYATSIDITDRKRSEDELLLSKKGLEALAVKLQEQNRQLDEFAHIISHNLRSPIGNIKALINLLNDQSTVEDYRVIFDKLKNVSNNLGETMNDLMDTLRVKTDTSIERVEIRFKEVLDRVIQSLEGELIRSSASITFSFDQAPTVRYSKPYMESIFQNLLSNAIKYRSPDRKPVIHFETQVQGGAVVLRVSDNGLGIDLTRFGDKLFGLHKTFHDHKEAKGVGLFLIKTQVEALGGSITAESEVGKGTTFYIRF